MDSAPGKAFLLVQILLVLSCFQEASASLSQKNLILLVPPVHPPTEHHHHRHAPGHPPVHPPSHHHHGHPPSVAPFHPPAHPPVEPPSHAPFHPPAHPPVKPPVPFPPSSRSYIAVQGVVYCKSCRGTFFGPKPIFGAQVKLLCKNTRYSVVATAKTDKNGYFFIQAPKRVTNFASHKCKVYLVSSPISSCRQASNLNGGVTGAPLRWVRPPSIKLPFILYSVGPFAFEPKCRA